MSQPAKGVVNSARPDKGAVQSTGAEKQLELKNFTVMVENTEKIEYDLITDLKTVPTREELVARTLKAKRQIKLWTEEERTCKAQLKKMEVEGNKKDIKDKDSELEELRKLLAIEQQGRRDIEAQQRKTELELKAFKDKEMEVMEYVEELVGHIN